MAKDGPSGGLGGKEFNDEAYLREGSSVAEVRIWTGSRVDAVQMVLRDKNGATYELTKHGGGGGDYHSLALGGNEKVIEVSGRCGSEVDSIRIVTNLGRDLRGGGDGGGTDFKYENAQILGFTGREGEPAGAQGCHIDAIGIVYRV